MLFKVAFLIFLAHFFFVVDLVDPKGVDQNNSQKWSTQSTVDKANNSITTIAPEKDPCPNNQSMHSRKDVKDLINFVYQQLSIDEKIRKQYESTAIAHRDKYINSIKQFEDWLQNQPQHFKHVLESLSRIRKDIISPDVTKIAKLLQDNSELYHVYDEKNKTFHNLKRKLQRYKAMCKFNCEEDNNHEGHVIFKRSVQEDYICSSLTDLYNKIQGRLSQFLERFINESSNRFATEDAKFRKKMENVTNSLREQGLQTMSGTIYQVLLLQDEYHHFTQKLNYSATLEQINFVKNLSIQLDGHMLQLSELIDNYGQKCQNCKKELNFRHIRQVSANPGNGKENPKEHSKSLLDNLLDEKFNETAAMVQKDLDNIFKKLLDLIDEHKNKHLNLEEFKKIKEEVTKMILQEKEALHSLSLSFAHTGVEDLDKLAKLIAELIQVIKEIIDEFKHL